MKKHKYYLISMHSIMLLRYQSKDNYHFNLFTIFIYKLIIN